MSATEFKPSPQCQFAPLLLMFNTIVVVVAPKLLFQIIFIHNMSKAYASSPSFLNANMDMTSIAWGHCTPTQADTFTFVPRMHVYKTYVQLLFRPHTHACKNTIPQRSCIRLESLQPGDCHSIADNWCGRGCDNSQIWQVKCFYLQAKHVCACARVHSRECICLGLRAICSAQGRALWNILACVRA